MGAGIPVHNGKNSLKRTTAGQEGRCNVWKLFSWLWKAAAAALLASFLAIWTTGYIVNSYVEALLEEYEIPLEKPPFALSGMWGRLWGAETGANIRGWSGRGRGAGSGGRIAASRKRTAAPAAMAARRGRPEGSRSREPAARARTDGGSGLHEGAVGGPEGEGAPGGASGDPDQQPGNEDEGGEASGAAEESGFGTGPEAHGSAGIRR